MQTNDDSATRFFSTSERITLLEFWIEELRSNSFTNGTTMLRMRGQYGWIYSPLGVLVQMLVDEPRLIGSWEWMDLVETQQSPRPWLINALGLTVRCSAEPGRTWQQHIEYLNRTHLTFRHIADVLEHRMLPELAKRRLIPKK